MLQSAQIAIFNPSASGTTKDLVAIAGIIGTLAGAALGAVVTAKVQERQLAHENATRFHEQRILAYAKFNQAAGFAVAACKTGTNSTKAIEEVIESWESLRLIASQEVIDAAAPVHAAVANISAGKVVDKDALVAKFNSDMPKLLAAIRDEISVKKM